MGKAEAEALEADQEAVEIPDDPPGGAEGSGREESAEREPEEKPALESDEVANLDLSGLTADVQAETGDTDPADQEADQEEDDDSSSSSSPDAGAAFGDMYVDTLAVVLVAIVEEQEPQADVDAEEIGEMARGAPFCLDEHVDALAEEAVGGSDLPPGKAAVLMTALLVGMVLVTETDMAGDLVGRAGHALEEARDGR